MSNDAIIIPVDEETKERWKRAATRQGMTLGEWIYDTLGYASDPESGFDCNQEEQRSVLQPGEVPPGPTFYA